MDNSNSTQGQIEQTYGVGFIHSTESEFRPADSAGPVQKPVAAAAIRSSELLEVNSETSIQEARIGADNMMNIKTKTEEAVEVPPEILLERKVNSHSELSTATDKAQSDKIDRDDIKKEAINVQAPQTEPVSQIMNKEELEQLPETTALVEDAMLWRNNQGAEGNSEKQIDQRSALGNNAEIGIESINATPRYDLNAPPEYPDVARHKGWQGVVELEVLVLVDGSVGELKITKSSGYKVLDRSARRAVKYWLFKPEIKDGLPVESRIEFPLEFELYGH